MKIRAYIDYNEWTKQRYYEDFEAIDELPSIKNLDELVKNTKLTDRFYNGACIEIEDIYLDAEQGDDKVYNYNFYKITSVDIADYHNDNDEDKDVDDYIYTEYACIEREEDEELEEEE